MDDFFDNLPDDDLDDIEVDQDIKDLDDFDEDIDDFFPEIDDKREEEKGKSVPEPIPAEPTDPELIPDTDTDPDSIIPDPTTNPDKKDTSKGTGETDISEEPTSDKDKQEE